MTERDLDNATQFAEGTLVMTVAALVLSAVVLLSGLVDFPRTFAVGPMSALAAMSLGYAAASGLLLLFRPASTRTAVSVLVPFVLFVTWGFWTFTWYRPTPTGFQNLLITLAFVMLALLSAREVHRSPETCWRIGRALTVAGVLASGFHAVGIVLNGGLGSGLFVTARAFALFALLGLAWCLSGWRYGSRIWLVAATVMLILIASSLSRLALLAGTLLVPLALMGSGRAVQRLRFTAWSLVAVASFAWAVSSFDPLRQRFFEGDLSIRAGQFAINASGRTRFWEVTIASIAESPWFGKGAGSVAESLAIALDVSGGHPHSDYLRIVHDYGLIGLGFWLLGLALLLRATRRAWMRADRARLPEARIHLAAFLACVAVALGMSTDNAMVYVFIMAPFGALVGASLGSVTRVEQPVPPEPWDPEGG